jgi:hypothetical protein
LARIFPRSRITSSLCARNPARHENCAGHADRASV